ncbi:hypothetical protein [Pseudoponticoccus marisrubri]|uniref:Uncharacterized protein n=1 Tax=Pseudoponticoccus marisrubri TaxID=1685382 RepID=A0A0W7WF58_9RHOB|nr:hypothetical protein [Pseudoponticoccus marisrubri]KUF09267.1 hypothetical protein AVJ23_18615 [Pseudoponticoccus marisrubri]
MIRSLALCLVLAPPALAQCPAEQAFLSCQIGANGKWLEVCVAGSRVDYRYGDTLWSPELHLSDHAAQVDYRPWSGVGRTIFEEVRFINGSYEYRVHGALERALTAGQTDRASGGVEVYKGGARIAALDCAPQATLFGWSTALSDAKWAAGLKWNPGTGTWQPRGGN